MSILNNALMFLADAPATCSLADEEVTDMVLTVLHYVRLVVNILQIVVPVALILWGTIDMAKSVISGDEKKIKEARKPLIQRFVSAIIVFLIPFIVNVVVNLITSNSEYKGCWDAAKDYEVGCKLADEC